MGRGLKGLKRYRSNGIEYVYHRATGTNLTEFLPENSKRFLEEYLKCEGGTLPAKMGSFGLHVGQYLTGNTFKAMKPSTQDVYRRVANKIRDDHGHKPLEKLEARHIQADLDKFPPHVANTRLRVWKHLTPLAKDIQKAATPKTDGHTPWTRGDVGAFRNHWPMGSSRRLAFEVFQWTGARVVDARVLGKANTRSGWIEFIQEKTGYPCVIPYLTDDWEIVFDLVEDWNMFREAVKAADQQLIWILSEYGKPRSVKGLSQWMAAAARAAGLEGLTAHGLRKYRDIELAEAGYNSLQIRSWTGQQDLKTLEIYIRNADRKRVLLSKNPNRLSKS